MAHGVLSLLTSTKSVSGGVNMSDAGQHRSRKARIRKTFASVQKSQRPRLDPSPDPLIESSPGLIATVQTRVVTCVVTLPSLPVSGAIVRCRSGTGGGAGKMRRTRMDTASTYHSGSFVVASSRTGSRFDTVEVRSSSLLVPTISFNGLASLPAFRKSPNSSIKHTEPGK